MVAKIRNNEANGKGTELADILHFMLFVALSIASGFCVSFRNTQHFLMASIVNAATAHCISRVYVSFSFLKHSHGRVASAHLMCGILSLAYALAGWFKLTFPYHAISVFKLGSWIHRFDLCYRTLCYVGQIIMLVSGMIMLRKSQRMPWTFVQTFSFLVQVQLASIFQHLLLLTFSYDEHARVRSISGARTVLATLGFATSIVSVCMVLANCYQTSKIDNIRKCEEQRKKTEEMNHVGWMDIFVAVFVRTGRYCQPQKWSPSMVRFGRAVSVAVLVNTASLLVAQVNLMNAREFPGLQNEVAAFYVFAVNDIFILGYVSAAGFDTTLQYQRKLSNLSAVSSVATAILAFAVSFPLAGHALNSDDADAFQSVWKGVFWPLLGSVNR